MAGLSDQGRYFVDFGDGSGLTLKQIDSSNYKTAYASGMKEDVST